ncbi:uncharacterized protein LOC128647675 [Bombina bombina]|uniref:uncharacterized protein LOC128647675 n=1 Tax=Bombina bombina TaxID=8345 RepID=UPI00235A9F13|nr:uncharacterized protein LOC128647675 [Bombina bombina]
MEPFPKLRHGHQACMVRRTPVSPCPTPAHEGSTDDLVPVICTSVLLSEYYPPFTQWEMESKIKGGKIHRGLGYFNGNKFAVPRDNDVSENQMEFPKLDINREVSVSKYNANINKSRTPGFFLNISHLQKQLISGDLRGRRSLPKSDPIKLITSSSKHHKQMIKHNSTNTISKKSRDQLFPPILDVWAQNDAMQRSIRLWI